MKPFLTALILVLLTLPAFSQETVHLTGPNDYGGRSDVYLNEDGDAVGSDEYDADGTLRKRVRVEEDGEREAVTEYDANGTRRTVRVYEKDRCYIPCGGELHVTAVEEHTFGADGTTLREATRRRFDTDHEEVWNRAGIHLIVTEHAHDLQHRLGPDQWTACECVRCADYSANPVEHGTYVDDREAEPGTPLFHTETAPQGGDTHRHRHRF